MKRILIIAIFLLIAVIPTVVHAQTDPVSIVRKYERLMQQWLRTGDDTYREQIERMLAKSGRMCIFADNIAQRINVQMNQNGSVMLATYLNYLEDHIPHHLKFSIVDPKEKKRDGNTYVFAWVNYSWQEPQAEAIAIKQLCGFRITNGMISSVFYDGGEEMLRQEEAQRKNIVVTQPDNRPTKQQVQQQSIQQQPTGTTAGHEWVDLGLPSGTLWATTNVGADNPWDYGDYFAWGETEPKSTYSWSNYKYCKDGKYDKLTKYCNNKKYGNRRFSDNKTVLDPFDDAATANWGSEWRMPTAAESTALRSKCYWVWTENYHGVKGYIVYKALKESDKGKKIYKGRVSDATYSLDRVAHIFLPAAGFWRSGENKDVGFWGYFWSSSIFSGNSSGPLYLYFKSGLVVMSSGNRSCGRSVRPVRCSN